VRLDFDDFSGARFEQHFCHAPAVGHGAREPHVRQPAQAFLLLDQLAKNGFGDAGLVEPAVAAELEISGIQHAFALRAHAADKFFDEAAEEMLPHCVGGAQPARRHAARKLFRAGENHRHARSRPLRLLPHAPGVETYTSTSPRARFGSSRAISVAATGANPVAAIA